MMRNMTNFRDLVILIPHQMPPKLVDPEKCELKEDEDQYVAGDHDMHSACTVGEWLDFPHIRGHQKFAVNSMVRDAAQNRGEDVSI